MQTLMTIAGAADALVFEAFIEHFLVPTLHAGQIVAGALWAGDNLSIHQGERVRRSIEQCACTLLFLPSYAPDCSPIEAAWSKLKTHLRRVGARTREVLEQAVAQGLELITAKDAQGWFRHCGYHLAAQLL